MYRKNTKRPRHAPYNSSGKLGNLSWKQRMEKVSNGKDKMPTGLTLSASSVSLARYLMLYGIFLVDWMMTLMNASVHH